MTERMDRILITGASGGLGEALALHYAARGKALALWGRNEVRLEEVADACRQIGAVVRTRSIDIANVSAAIEALRHEDETGGAISLAIFAAGSGDARSPGGVVEDPFQIERLGMVNFVAPCAMAAAMAERMVARRHGGIVFVGSAAAFHALPFAAAYSGSKAGLSRFADALRLDVRAHGVRVTLVSPGFIDTAAGRRIPGPRPFSMQPGRVAARIAEAAGRGRAHLVLPWPFVVLRWLDRLLPGNLRDRLLISLEPPAAGRDPGSRDARRPG